MCTGKKRILLLTYLLPKQGHYRQNGKQRMCTGKKRILLLTYLLPKQGHYRQNGKQRMSTGKKRILLLTYLLPKQGHYRQNGKQRMYTGKKRILLLTYLLPKQGHTIGRTGSKECALAKNEFCCLLTYFPNKGTLSAEREAKNVHWQKTNSVTPLAQRIGYILSGV